MIPPFDPSTGLLPAGVHEATWEECVARLGWTPRRLALLAGLKAALDALRAAGVPNGLRRRQFRDGLQYRVTRTAARQFAEALTRLDDAEGHRPLEMRALMREAMESQLEDLRQQLADYDALRSGHIQVLELDSLTQLPEALIRARIAAGLTQKALAKRLGMREQQVQRYEATHYAGVGLTRLQMVADALGVRIHERVVLPTAAVGSAPNTNVET